MELDSPPDDIELFNTLYGIMLTNDGDETDFINSNGEDPEIKLGSTCHINEHIFPSS